MVEVSLKNRCAEATLIIEGRVLERSCFWDLQHKHIYTKNLVDVYKVFKGKLSSQSIEIITEGGVVEDNMEDVSNSLILNIMEDGMFLIKPSKIKFPASFDAGVTRYEAVAATQGFIKYDAEKQSASDVFYTYPNIKKDLYKVIKKHSKQKTKVIKSNDITHAVKNANKNSDGIANIMSIGSFSPTTISSGTKSTLTITGSGFGTTRGTSTVGFKNADTGGGSYTNPDVSEYLTWSDTQIQLYVPSKAGTGTIQVTVNSTASTSSSNLTVTYARSNVVSTSGTFLSPFVGINNNSGYNWQYNSNFNSTAKSAFLRAFSTWRCATFVNWQISANTSSINDAASDNINIITFDNANPLPSGVLGRCTNYRNSCSTGVWYVKELDIVFSSATNWNYTTNTSFTGSDFESVTLHELGHGHQLGHVINNTDVMHYSISSGAFRRTLNQYNLNCGTDVMSGSNVAICSNSPMTALTNANCQITVDLTAPLSTAFNPVNNSTLVPVNGNLIITFNETIAIGTSGNIIIKTGSNTFATISITDANQISVAGNTLTINPTANLSDNTNYFVNIDNGAVKDVSGNDYIGISDASTWTFTTDNSSGISYTGKESLIKIIPNPSNGTFTIESDASFKNIVFEVYNLAGQIVYKDHINTNRETVTLNQAPGIYLVKIKNEMEILGTNKIVIE